MITTAATHSATLGVLLGLCAMGWMARPFLRERLPLAGLAQASLTIVAGGVMLVSANYALSGKLAWTPGGYGVAFGRMVQDGIVARASATSSAPIATSCRRAPTNSCGATACSTRSAASKA